MDSPNSLSGPDRVLVANSCPLTRKWIEATLAVGVDGCVTELVSDGVDLLIRLAEHGPYSLVVTSASLPGISGSQVLAMARTAGLHTPFVLTSVVADSSLRGLVARAAPATLVEDPLDTVALRSAARAMLAQARPPSIGVEWHKAFASLGAPMPSAVNG